MIAVAVLVAGLAAAAPTVSDAEVVSSLVAAAASKDARLDVLSAADVRNAVDLEAQRSIMGCDQTSCLLEVAGAMDARFVVHGTLGALGDVVVLTLSAFDTTTASAIGRVVLQEAKVDALGRKLQGAVDELFVHAPVPPAGTRMRTVVLDVRLAAPPVATPTAPAGADAEASFPWAPVALFGVGAAGLVVGIGADAIAYGDAASITAATVLADGNELQSKRDALVPVSVIGYGVALVASAAGAALLFMGGGP